MNPRRLYRSHDRRLAGVAGGMGEYLDLDPTIVRILWILAAFASAGLAIIAYVLFALVMPTAPWPNAPAGTQWYGTPNGAPPTWGPNQQAPGWGYPGAQPTWGQGAPQQGWNSQNPPSQPSGSSPAATPSPEPGAADPS